MSKTRLLLFLLLFSMKGSLSAQLPDTTIIYPLIRQIDEHFNAEEIAEALAKARQARSYLIAVNSPDTLLANIHHRLGIAHYYMGQVDSTISHWQQTLQLRSQFYDSTALEVALSVNNLGIAYDEKGYYHKAIGCYEKALAVFRKVKGPDSPYTGNAYTNLAVAYVNLGDYMHALEHFERAKDIDVLHFGENSSEVADDLLNLGGIHEKIGDYEKAIDYFKRAQAIVIPLFGEKSARAAEIYGNLGVCGNDIGNYDLAIRYFERELSIMRRLKEERPIEIAKTHMNLGTSFLAKGQMELSLDYYTKALDIRREIFRAGHPQIAILIKKIGRVNQRRRKFDVALKQITNASNILGYSATDYSNFGSVIDKVELLDCFIYKAEIFEELSMMKNENTSLDSCLYYYELTLDLIEDINVNLTNVESKQLMIKKNYDVFGDLIKVWNEKFSQTKDEKIINEVVKVLERSRSLALREALMHLDAVGFSGVPDTVFRKEKQLKMDYFYWEKLWMRDIDNLVLKKEVFEGKRKYEEYLSVIKRDFNSYYKLRFDLNVPDLQRIQEKIIDTSSVLIEYFFGRKNLYAIVVSSDEASIHDLGDKDYLNGLVVRMRDLISEYPNCMLTQTCEGNEYLEVGHLIFEKIIAPFKSQLTNRVVIAPDGILWQLPFDALLTSFPDDATGPKQYPFFGQSYFLSYTYSALLLDEMKHTNRGIGNGDFLGIAPVFSNRERAMSLKYNQEEVMGIQETIQGRSLLGKAATKQAFMELASKYGVLHLATHSNADTIDGIYSYLMFFDSSNVEKSGFLYVNDIYGLELNSNMVVLSACETGVGEIRKGEGVICLARAFSYAGARSVITSLWKINDRQTSQIMIDFYKFLKEGYPKDIALSMAKRSYIDQSKERLTHPYYWAGFIPLGDMDSINISSNGVKGKLTYGWMIFFGLILAILVVFKSMFNLKK